MTTPPPAVGRSGGSAAIRLITGREITTRLRSKALIVTTILFVVLMVAGGFLLKLATGSGPTEYRVGVLAQDEGLGAVVADVARDQGAVVETVVLPDATESVPGSRQLRDGDLDAVLTGVPDQPVITVRTSLDPTLHAVLTDVTQRAALADQVSALGGDPTTVEEAVARSTPEVAEIEPAPRRDGSQIAAGYVAGILLFIALMTCGQMVAQGVVEEKSSRVVELLLAVVRPWQLMAGKVLGIGLVGLGQVVVIVAAGAGTAVALGLVDTGSLDLGATAGWAIVWFVVGFTMYALAMAALAALVSRQEDVGTVTAPMTTLMMIPYVIGVSLGPWDPTNPLIVWLSRIPFCSPLLMPMRTALDSVSTGEALAVLALNVAVVPLLVWLGGRVYAGAVLRTGSRVKLRDALRAG